MERQTGRQKGKAEGREREKEIREKKEEKEDEEKGKRKEDGNKKEEGEQENRRKEGKKEGKERRGKLKHISKQWWPLQRELWGCQTPQTQGTPAADGTAPCAAAPSPKHISPNHQNHSQLCHNPYPSSVLRDACAEQFSPTKQQVGWQLPNYATHCPTPCPSPRAALRLAPRKSGIIPAKPQSSEHSGQQSLLFLCLSLHYLCPLGATLLPAIYNAICLFSMSASFFFDTNTLQTCTLTAAHAFFMGTKWPRKRRRALQIALENKPAGSVQ